MVDNIPLSKKVSLPYYVGKLNQHSALIVIAILLLALLSIVVDTTGIEFWFFDDYQYVNDVHASNRTYQEGRWLSHATFDLAHPINAFVAWVANLLLIGSGLYIIAHHITREREIAFAITIMALITPTIAAQNIWPTTTLTSTSIFLVCVLLTKRYGIFMLPFCGILSFGVISYFFYLLPLMFLPQKRIGTFWDFGKALIPGLVWFASLFIGYLFSSFLNFFYFGEFGVHLHEWRSPSPVKDWASLITNLLSSWTQLTTHMSQWLPTLSFLCLPAVAGFYLWRRKIRSVGYLTIFVICGYLIVVTLSPYLTTIYHGIRVDFRSTLPLAFGLIIFPFALFKKETYRSWLIAITVIIGLPSAWTSISEISLYAKQTQIFTKSVQSLPSHYIEDYDLIVVDTKDFDLYREKRLKSANLYGQRLKYFEPLIRPVTLNPAFLEGEFPLTLLCPEVLSDDNYILVPHCAKYFLSEEKRPACLEFYLGLCIYRKEDKTLFVRMVS